MKTKNIIILFILSMCFIEKVHTQSVYNNVYNDYSHVTSWNTYNGEFFGSVLNLMNGNTIAFSYSRREDTIQNNIYGVEVSVNGDTLKTLNINLGNNTISKALSGIQLADSTIYLFGYTTDNVYTLGENPRGLVVKLDKNLNHIWHQDNYNIADRHRFSKPIYSINENVFYVLSYASVDTSDLNANFDIFISKIDTSGNLLNNWQFGGIDWDLCFDLETLNDGTFILSGYTYTNAAGTLGNPDFYILKVDTFGSVLWEKRYGYPGQDYTEGRKSLYVDDNYIMAVSRHEKMDGSYAGWLLKMNMQGDTIWSKFYERDLVYSILKGVEKWDNNSFILMGSTQDKNFLPASKPQAWLVKIDTLGNKIWERFIGAYPNDDDAQTYIYDYEFAPDKGILLAGYVLGRELIENGINHRNDAWLAKTDSCGYTAGDIPSPFFVVDSVRKNQEYNTVFITEQSQDYCTAEIDWGDGSENEFYYAYENNLPLAEKQFQHNYTQNGTYTIKVTTLAGEEFREFEVIVGIVGVVGIEDITAEQAAISLFPNPSSDYIVVENPNSGKIPNRSDSYRNGNDVGFEMSVFSLNGKQVQSFDLNPKLYQQKIDISSLVNGVYFVNFIQNGEIVGREKLVIAK